MTDPIECPLRERHILDLTQLLPGLMATLHFADTGAEMPEIENRGDMAPVLRVNEGEYRGTGPATRLRG